METLLTQISYSDVEKFLIELRFEIEQIRAKTPLTQIAKLEKLERRSENVLSAINMIQSEAETYERGICCVCGSLGGGVTNDKTYCGFHGQEVN